MKIKQDGQRMSISHIPELSAVNSVSFRDEVQAALSPSLTTLDIDLSQTLFVDSSGLGALFSLYKNTGNGHGVKMRLLNPAPQIQQLLELTQMHQFFEITKD
jgi:anti-sigma B factor antagonist